MFRFKAGLITVCLLSLMLSACHARGYELRKMRWVNQADAQDVMQFEVRSLTVMGKMHAAVFATRVTGTYVHKKGDAVISQGTLTQEAPGFILKSSDGEEHKLAIEKTGSNTGSLKGEDGAVWELDNPTKPLAVLKEW